MKKIILLSLSLIMCVMMNNGYAQSQLSDSHITGHVIDKNTGEHLPFITIYIKGLNIATATDVTGHYAFNNVPIGKHTVVTKGIGYLSDSKEITIVANNTYVLDFELTPDALQLEQIVVTGNKSAVKRRNSSTLINVVNKTTFEMVGAACLADGLTFQPGVRVEDNCQNCGFAQVRINGLDGHYSQILMDSRPIFSALTGVYGLEQIPATMIERVEVIRGGGSALFGSSAIGGTVNIITKDPIVNSAEVAHTMTSIGISDALDNNTTLNASIVSPNNKAGIFIYGQNRTRDGYDHNGDGFSELPTIKSQTIGLRSFLKTSDNSKLTLQYHGIHEFRRGGDNISKPPHEAEVAEQLDHNINGGGASFDIYSTDYSRRLNIYSSFQNTLRDSYYGANKSLDAYGNTKDFVIVSGAQYTQNWNRLWFMPAEFLAGIEHSYNSLVDEAIKYDHYVNQKINVFGAYAQNEWRNDKWGFLIGARLDKHSLLDKLEFSPRANIRFNPSKSVNFRLTYSSGFRAPQAYDEDFHVAVVGGERVVTILADGLKPEKSQSLSFSTDLYHTFGTVQTNLLIEGFYTDLKDVFALRKLDEPDEKGNQVLERYNGSGATVMGINLEAKAVFNSRIQAQAGFTFQRSRYKEAEQWSEDVNVKAETKMFRAPDLYGYFTLSYAPIKPLSFSITGAYTGPMLVQHMAGSGTDVDKAVMTQSFIDVNAKVAYDFRLFDYVKIQVNAGVKNMFNSYQTDFDKGAGRDSGYIYGPSMPRSLFVGAKINI